MACAQKKCAAERRLIVFIDESGLSERPTRVRTWAPKGCTPHIQFHFNWKHVSAVAGLTRTNFMFRLHDGAIKSAQIVEFLGAEIDALAGGAAMAAEIDQDTAPALFGKKQSPGEHRKAGNAVTVEENDRAAGSCFG